MKLRLFKAFFTAGVVAVGIITAINEPSQAQARTFYCGQSKGVPSTLVNTPRGTVVVVKWVSRHFNRAGYNPQKRCEEVSSRFQRHYNQGNLNFITAGYLNNQPAVCAGNGGAPCTSEKLLFTLKPGQNAANTIQQLFNIRTGAAGPLYESTRASQSSSVSVVDMNKFLQEAPIVNANTPVRTPKTPSSNGGSAW
ncbi:MAG: COP23 domain-containing protein [Cyanobacteria bacterium P01_A01_bin.84]